MNSTEHTNAGPAGYNLLGDACLQAVIAAIGPAQRRQLHTRLKALDLSGWLDWLQHHAAESEQYLVATPAARAERIDKTDGLLVAYGAVWLVQLSGLLSTGFDDPALHHPALQRAARGHLLWQAWNAPIEMWPFDEPLELGDPF